MSWNPNDNDPWGRKNSPPDLDDAIKQLRKMFFSGYKFMLKAHKLSQNDTSIFTTQVRWYKNEFENLVSYLDRVLISLD